MSWSEDHMVSRLTYPACRIGYEWNIRRWTSYARKQQKRMIFLTSKSLALDQHAKQYEALFSGGTVNISWCRMPQHSKLNFAIKHKAWHYIDNIQNKLLRQEYLSRVTIYFQTEHRNRKKHSTLLTARASHSKISNACLLANINEQILTRFSNSNILN